MMLDPSPAFYLILFAGVFAVGIGTFGLLSSSGGDAASDDEQQADAADAAPVHDVAAYMDDLAAADVPDTPLATPRDATGVAIDDDSIVTDTPDEVGPEIDNAVAETDNIFLAGDDATPEDDDSFAVYEIADHDAPAAHVTDFDAQSDALHIQYLAETDPDTGDPITPTLSVSYSPETDVTSIALDGVEIAALDGDAGITAADIRLSPIV